MNIKLFKYYKLKYYLYYLYFLRYIHTSNVYIKYKTPDFYMALSCILLCIPGIYGVCCGQYMVGIFACIMSFFSLNGDYLSLYNNNIIKRYTSLLCDQLGILLYIISLTLLYIQKKFYMWIIFN